MESLLLGPFSTAPRPTLPALSRRECQKPFRERKDGVYWLSSKLSVGRLQGRIFSSHGASSQFSMLPGKNVRKSYICAAASHPSDSESELYGSRNPAASFLAFLNAFYKFSRPHTVIGTALSIISVSLLAVEKLSDISPLFFMGLLQALVSALFMNIYIVGLNQVFDIEIDKVNKPYLPLASGEFSIGTGITIVLSSALLSFAIGLAVGSRPLFLALFISFVLGTAYSTNLPMLRWKRSAVVAAMCILAVRAVVVQLAFFMHMQNFVFCRPSVFTRPLVFATAFMSFFSVVIALFKDIPDIDGDRIYGIRSFSVRLGQKRVFWICIYLLQLAYCVATVLGVSSPCLWSKVVTVPGHIFLALFLWSRANSMDIKSQEAIKSFYMFIWQLFYAEYLLIPLYWMTSLHHRTGVSLPSFTGSPNAMPLAFETAFSAFHGLQESRIELMGAEYLQLHSYENTPGPETNQILINLLISNQCRGRRIFSICCSDAPLTFTVAVHENWK